MASIDASLGRLGLDYVDLYQIHRFDRNTPVEETMDALHDVVHAGKARYIGASSMFAWQFAKAQHVARTPFISMQNHYNLIYREEEREMIPQCLDQGVGIIPWSPLARGLLAGNRTREGDKRTTRARTDVGASVFVHARRSGGNQTDAGRAGRLWFRLRRRTGRVAPTVVVSGQRSNKLCRLWRQ